MKKLRNSLTKELDKLIKEFNSKKIPDLPFEQQPEEVQILQGKINTLERDIRRIS